jgi:tetratricopeptide (TPR) repeat protein
MTPLHNTILPPSVRRFVRQWLWQSILGPIFSLAFLFATVPVYAQPNELATQYVSEANQFMAAGNYPKAAVAFTRAITEGLRNPYLYRGLSIALYNMHLVDDSIAALEKAAALDTQDTYTKMALGILYLTKDRLREAETQLCTALRENPGLSEAYYFLGELYFREQRFGLAWIAARTAEKLGYESSLLLDKLAGSAPEPDQYPWQVPQQKLALRQLLLDSREDAQKVLQWLGRGKLFEYALRSKPDPEKKFVRYVGEFKPEDLRPEIAAALQGREVYSTPVLAQTGDSFLLVQRILPFDFGQWKNLTGGGAGFETGMRQSAKPSMKDESLVRQTIDHSKVQVHVGAFLVRQIAFREAEKLRKLGFPAFLLIRQKADGKTWYYLIAGQYDTRQQADMMMEQLRKQGYEGFIVPAK